MTSTVALPWNGTMQTPCRSNYGKICYATAHKIWPHCTFETTTLPVFAKSHQVWKRQLSTFPTRWQSPTGWSRKEKSPTNCWQLPILCTGSGSHYINGTIWDIIATKCPDRKHNETCGHIQMQSSGTLHLPLFSMITLMRLTSLHPRHAAVPVVASSLLVYRAMETHSNLTGPFMSRAPSSSWLLHPQQKPNWGTLPECTRSKSILTCPCRTRTSTTTYTNSQRQQNHSQYCKQHHQKSAIAFNGNEILFGLWQSCAGCIQCKVAPWPRKSCGLSK